jgi:hypothetical protein
MKNSSLFKSKEFQTPADKTQETELKGKTMVGLNSLWTFFISFTLLWSCVPQTKQTECASNEAFNASLRSCVPVVGGPTSFIKIDNFSPALPISVHKNDSTVIPLTITIDNPYAQSYTIEWERIYYGATTFYGGDTTTTSFIPLSFASELGPHFITAKIIAEGEVVDSHTFQINVSESPRPVVNSSTVTPASYALTLTPLDSPQEFSFSVKNNNAIISGAGYTTTWTLIKDGVVLQTESDSFTNTSTNGTNTFYFGTSVSSGFEFVPQDLGVGSYTLRAIVANTTPGEIVGEVQWSITLKHPDKSKIQTRHIYEGSTSPSYATTIVAYNGVPFTTDTTYNFIPTGQTNQGDFCVEIEDGDGTYPEDFEEEVYGAGNAEYVRVDFYLDNTTLIYTTYTTASDETVCLSDAASAILDTVLFTNTTTTSSQTHTLVARVFDERTNSEYTNTDLKSGLGTYPITWNFNVKPVNAAPTVTFTSSSNLENITCTSTVGYTKNCTVTQDESFLVGINAVDEFYTTSSTTDSHQNQFAYTMTLYRNGNVIDTCTKLSSDDSDTNIDDVGDAGVDFIGPDYLCEFNVSSFDSSGSIDPEGEDYSIAIVFQDMGSPITGSSPAISQTLYYNLTVTEANTAPVIVAQGTDSATTSWVTVDGTTPLPTSSGGATATEGDTVNFMIKISDSERDDHVITIKKCSDSDCDPLGSTVVSSAVVKTDDDLTTETSLLWSIPEDLLDADDPITAPGTQVYFQVSVYDEPDDIGLSEDGTSRIFTFFVLNKNPAPYFSSPENPTADLDDTMDSDDYKRILAGVPFSIDPGTVTDDSTATSEATVLYQWYVNFDRDDNGTTDEEYEKIDGATSRILKWTPSLTHSSTAANPTLLKLCVTDDTTINPLPDDSDVDTAPYLDDPDQDGENCKGPWKVVVHSATALLDNGFRTGIQLDQDVAIWYDNKDSTYDATNGPQVIFVAYSLSDLIYVDKIVIDNEGKIYSTSAEGFQTQFVHGLRTMDGSTNLALSGSIKNISLTGNETHLYIAYQATLETSTTFNSIAVIRMDKRSGEINSIDYGERITTSDDPADIPFPHPGKFGIQPAFSIEFLNDFTDIAATDDSSREATVITFNDSSQIVDDDNYIRFYSDLANVTIVGDDDGDCDEDKICADLSEDENAARVAVIINESYLRNFQGFTASHSGSSVTIYGAYIYDSSNLKGDIFYTLPSGGVAPHTGLDFSVLDIGKIVIADDDGTERWFLPYIDNSSPGSEVKVLTQITASALTSVDMHEVPIVVTSGNALGNIVSIESELDVVNERLILGVVNSSNVASAYSIDFDDFNDANAVVVNSTTSLFSGSPIESGTLRMAAPKSSDNSNFYFVAKVLDSLPSTYRWKMSMYPTFSGTPSNFTISSSVDSSGDTTDVLDDDNIKDISIQNYSRSGVTSNEARLMVSSIHNGSTDESNLYAVRFRAFSNDSTSYYFTCGQCLPLNDTPLSPTGRIASSYVATMTLGEAGNTTGESTKEFLFTVSASDPNGSTSGYLFDQPVIHALNMRGESIQSVTEDSSGGYRPPVIPP